MSSNIDLPTGELAIGPVLVDHQYRSLIESGALKGIKPTDIQPGSIDLRVDEIHSVSCRPSAGSFASKVFLEDYGHNPALSRSQMRKGVTLVPGRYHSYLMKLSANLALPPDISGVCNTKSSIGRVGMNCAVICEDGKEFNQIPPGYKGPLFLAVAPQGFPVEIRSGVSVTQLRLYSGPRDPLNERDLRFLFNNFRIVVDPEDRPPTFVEEGVLCHVDLSGPLPNLVSQNRGKPFRLWEEKTADPTEYFSVKSLYKGKTLILDPGQFALVRTRERIRIPPFACAEMVAHREAQGHLTVHEAGFGDPGFGFLDGSHPGNRFVCELRNFGTDAVQISHDDPICVLRFIYTQFRPEASYGETGSHYQGQQSDILVAKFFKDWPAM